MSRRKRYTRNLGRKLPEPLPVRTTKEWVRFSHETEPYGVFSYVSELCEALGWKERAEVEEIMAWFNEHLDAPNDDIGLDNERFWFCVEATEHVDKTRRLAQLAKQANVPIVEFRTKRIPGKVKWQDPEQVAVITYRDSPGPRH